MMYKLAIIIKNYVSKFKHVLMKNVFVPIICAVPLYYNLYLIFVYSSKSTKKLFVQYI